MQLFFLLLALLASQVSGTIYTQGNNKVDVTVTYLNSTENEYVFIEKCAEFQSGAPEKYEKACFTERFTDEGTWDDCEIRFDDDTTW